MEDACLKWPAYHCPALCLTNSAPRPDESLVGTIGYLDPEYMSSGHVTEHCDVYALGVVLLQVRVGRWHPPQGQ